jgi:hypothetical protein
MPRRKVHPFDLPMTRKEKEELFETFLDRFSPTIGERLVIFALLFGFHNCETGQCNPRQTRIARLTGLELDTVQKVLAKYRFVIERERGRTAGGTLGTQRYRFRLPEMWPKAMVTRKSASGWTQRPPAGLMRQGSSAHNPQPDAHQGGSPHAYPDAQPDAPQALEEKVQGREESYVAGAAGAAAPAQVAPATNPSNCHPNVSASDIVQEVGSMDCAPGPGAVYDIARQIHFLPTAQRHQLADGLRLPGNLILTDFGSCLRVAVELVKLRWGNCEAVIQLEHERENDMRERFNGSLELARAGLKPADDLGCEG